MSRSEAKCHPDDKFDFETGAKIALDRLEIKKETEQSENPFKPGDIVECIFDYKVFGVFPPKGTLGQVIGVNGLNTLVRWAKGSTHGDGEWWISAYDIRNIYQPKVSFKVGDVVEYISDEVSQFDAIYFPPKGTRGEVLELDNHKSVDPCVRVRWEKGTTGGNGEWWCRVKKLKKVEFPKYSFKVGDRVRFRSWDDMKCEFGVDPRCPADICIKKDNMYFTVFMSPLCGTYATIKRIHSPKCGLIRVELTNFSSDTALLKYSFFVTDMLEPASIKKR